MMSEDAPPRRQIHFHVPGFKRYETEELAQCNRREFVSVSLTGAGCALQCEHCQGQILKSMLPIAGGLFEVCEKLAAQGTRGVLVSGGSDRRGRVPLASFGADLRRLKEELGLQVLVHTGIVDEAMAETLAEAKVDGALIDIIGSEDTMREVYHLEASPAAFDRSLALLERCGVPSLPHIVMGLHFGRFVGEEAALGIVANHRTAGLVLVALTPLLGTPMENAPSPALSDMISFTRTARQRLPATPIILGCARPSGPARAEMERAAIGFGVDAIAFPAEGTVAYARERGLEPQFHEACCGLPWLLGNGG